MTDELRSISDLKDKISRGKTSAKELVNMALEQADRFESYNSLIEINKQSAIAKAELIDDRINQGDKIGRLAGIPFVAKDNFLTFGTHTTAGSNILKNFISVYQSTAINKLESEGAILIGKANLDAFAHGSSTENSDFGVVKNPVDQTRVAGGSSGGSAAAVALGIIPFSLGSDTGGSIRLPASFCGVVGLKPTYGLVSRYGVVAMASSTDCIGPLANSVDDASLILDIICGKDDFDGTTIDRDERSYSNPGLQLPKTVGVIKQFMHAGLSDEVKKSFINVVDKMSNKGVEIVEIDIPSLDLALACYYILVPAEISSNLSRYDGVRYGLSDLEGRNLSDLYENTRSKGFNKENIRRIMIGTFVLSSGYYDAYYKKAQTVRTMIINQFNKAYEKVDCLISPTSATTAFPIGKNTQNPLDMYLTDIMTVAANLTGVPSISIPMESKNLPVGLQIMTPQKKDYNLLTYAKTIEKEII